MTLPFDLQVQNVCIRAATNYDRALKEGRGPMLTDEYAEMVKAQLLAELVVRIRSTIGTDGTKTFQEEENFRRHKSDDPPYFFQYEDGALGAMDRIPFQARTKRRVTDEDILALYFENLSPEEISKKLGRDLKRVNKALTKNGITPRSPKNRHYQAKDIPFGWKESDGKLVPDETEQWVNQKISDDLKKGIPPKQIAESLDKLGIKPRGGIWHEDRILRQQKLNLRLMTAWSRGQSGWKDLKEEP